jgi:hypothetical protein
VRTRDFSFSSRARRRGGRPQQSQALGVGRFPLGCANDVGVFAESEVQALKAHERTPASAPPLQSMHRRRIAFSPLAPDKRFSIG